MTDHAASVGERVQVASNGAATASADVDEESPLRPLSKPRKNAKMACIACRQMKMKCEGAASPPCTRCLKSGRECLLPVSNYAYPAQESVQPTYGTQARAPSWPEGPRPNAVMYPAASPSTASPHESRPTRSPATQQVAAETITSGPSIHVADYQTRNNSRSSKHQKDVAPDLPSIFATSPADAIREPHEDTGDTIQVQTRTKRKKINKGGQSQDLPEISVTRNSTQQSGTHGQIPVQDLKDLIHTFREKLLPYISALTPHDFEDAENLIKTQPSLAHCVGYVTARFLFEGNEIRKTLLPYVLQITRGEFTVGGVKPDELSNFKALLVLYSYANCSSPSTRALDSHSRDDILYWPLKSLVEVYALRLSLYDSIADLRTDLLTCAPGSILGLESYRRYIFWLQLFMMAHYCSVVSKTPPSIPMDSTIRAATAIMERIGTNPHAKLFAEVELCLIWEKACSHQRDLQEWWCQPDPSKEVDELAIQSTLLEADGMIDSWYLKWKSYISGVNSNGIILDYHGRCARFNINSHATRHLRKSSGELSATQKEQVRKCVTYASHVLDWPLELRPVQKDRLRYVTESGGIMISYCCLFIIASCQTFTSSVPNIFSILDKVVTTAHLMINMAPDAEHSANMQGLLILRRAGALHTMLEQMQSHEPAGHDFAHSVAGRGQGRDIGQEPAPDVFDFTLDAESLAAMEPFWDFSILAPVPW